MNGQLLMTNGQCIEKPIISAWKRGRKMVERISNVNLVRRNKESIVDGHNVVLMRADLDSDEEPETKNVVENVPLPVARSEAFKTRDQEVARGSDVQIWEETGSGPDDWRRI